MARIKRLKIEGEEAFYHIISRTVGGEFYLGDVEKEELLEIIRFYSKIFFVKVISYCIMSNHFHLLVKMEPEHFYNEEEIIERYKFYKNIDKIQIESLNLKEISQKLSDISEYVKSIKQKFARRYNRLNKRRGYFWGDRFKSVLIERGEALLNCMAYIELNPIRAGIVDRPEDYRWSSFCERNVGIEDFLSYEGTEIKDFKEYAEFVYMVGCIEVKGKKKQSKIKLMPKKRNIYLGRIRYFSDGVVIGSKGFVKEAYNRFSEIITKKNKIAHRVKELGSIFSIRRLNSVYV